MAVDQTGYDLLKGTEKMKNQFIIMVMVTAAAMCLKAQDFDPADTAADNSGQGEASTFASEQFQDSRQIDFENGENTASSPGNVANTMSGTEAGTPDEKSRLGLLTSNFTFSATVDMQVDKEMWNEFGNDSKNIFQNQSSLSHAYRKVVDDFWMRVALRAKYLSKYFESSFALRFYPYWTMRRGGSAFQPGPQAGDLRMSFDVLEINEAYLKVFKEYGNDDNRFLAHFKIGRDGLLITESQLFGNYLELPSAGYGDARSASVVGPFKNRKVFANQMEVGLNFELGEMLAGKTSIMFGGNVNNQKWYSAPTPPISEEMDSKLSAGFTRGYQDFYIWKKRVHLGGGFRVYTTKISKEEPVIIPHEGAEPETTSTSFAASTHYINGDWTFGVNILPNMKFYSEFGFQKLGSKSSTGIVRPFTAGITLPTGGVLDVCAIEIENVAKTFFSDKSMRDAVGNRKKTNSFAWGIVTEKFFLDERVGIAWGVYSGNAYGDMKTSLRITSNLK